MTLSTTALRVSEQILRWKMQASRRIYTNGRKKPSLDLSPRSSREAATVAKHVLCCQFG